MISVQHMDLQIKKFYGMMIYYNLFTESDQSLFSLVVAMSVSACLSVGLYQKFKGF